MKHGFYLIISVLVILANCISCYFDDYDHYPRRERAGHTKFFSRFGEFTPKPKKVFIDETRPKKKPKRRVSSGGDGTVLDGLGAMARSTFEGVTRWGKGAIGMSDITEDLEDKNHERYTGEVANYHSDVLNDYYPDRNQGRRRNRPSYRRSRRYEDYQDDYEDDYPVRRRGRASRGRVHNYDDDRRRKR